jgi:hypothetical protein
MESSVIEANGKIIISLYLANLDSSSGKRGRKAMKQAAADKNVGSRHVEKGIWKILRTNSGEAGTCVDYDAIEDSANLSIESASNM